VSNAHGPGHFGIQYQFPTPNIATPVVLLYGDSDSLVDIDSMHAQLPIDTISVPVRTLLAPFWATLLMSERSCLDMNTSIVYGATMFVVLFLDDANQFIY
jgi:hypothetical protein